MTSYLVAAVCLVLTMCRSRPSGPEPSAETRYVEVTNSHLPSGLSVASMDARPADVDGDGDVDLIVACEFCRNRLLLNNGDGRFTDASDRLPATQHDSEDIVAADLDGDGDVDIVFVSEDDQTNEIYLNDGSAVFSSLDGCMPVTGTSNAAVSHDVNGDGAPDLFVGNNGQNNLLVNDGSGCFVDETRTRLPSIEDVTQDLELGDVDGDGDVDLLVGNEDRNRLLINDGAGVFRDESDERIPLRSRPEETREADFGDVDGDGDLDIVFGNVDAFVPGADPQNRLLINDGTGHFADETEQRLESASYRSFDVDLVDVDGDGDLDLVAADAKRGADFSELIHLYTNDGRGVFRSDNEIFPPGLRGKWFDAEAADFDGDGQLDFYFASQRSRDRLIVQRPR